jgi:hypothetical protein
MARTPQPSPDLPWVLRQKGLKLLDMTTDESGHTVLTFRSPLGPVREVTISMLSSAPVTWTYGYTIRDTYSKTSTTYAGHEGDPAKDTVVEIEGF